MEAQQLDIPAFRIAPPRPVTVDTAWQVSGNGDNSFKFQDDHLSRISYGGGNYGYWFMTAGLNATQRAAVESLADTVVNTTAGQIVEGLDGRRQIKALTRGFCEAFDMMVVPEAQLPPSIRRMNNVVVFGPKHSAAQP